LALAARCRGQILLARGRPAEALPALRSSAERWSTLAVPYAAAVVRALLGACYQALGHEESARLEFDAARYWFDRLGARPDAERVTAPARPAGGLTPREREVLRLLATGTTNRSVAGALYLSEKTVARHLTNIYSKLGVASRAAATAYAYDHDLL
jgi:DNA-binding NarL/FixJ family response regulator